MTGEFLTCKDCDFEWHRKDGLACPICKNKSDSEITPEYHGGMFGTGKKPKRLALYYQAIGLIALVYLLYLVFGA